MSIFDKVISYMDDEIVLEPTELEQPVSVDSKGKYVTIGDVIAYKAPPRVKVAFAVKSPGKNHPALRSVRELHRDELKGLAVEFLKSADARKQLAVVGIGVYSKEDLIQQINRGTVVGEQIVQAVKNYATFVEAAVMAGKVVRKEEDRKLQLPDFDF